jgi:hypothetical protein
MTRNGFNFQTAKGHFSCTTVIASEAKQSISPHKGRMDCFVASAPRNDVVGSRFNFQTAYARPPSRGMVCPSFAGAACLPPKQRERGMPGARCTRGLVCKVVRRMRTRAYRFSGNTPASPRNGFTAYAVLSSATNSSCHRRCRLDGSSIRSDRSRHRQLDTSNGCRNHTVLPYAATRLRQKGFAGLRRRSSGA